MIDESLKKTRIRVLDAKTREFITEFPVKTLRPRVAVEVLRRCPGCDKIMGLL